MKLEKDLEDHIHSQGGTCVIITCTSNHLHLTNDLDDSQIHTELCDDIQLELANRMKQRTSEQTEVENELE